MKRSRLSAGGLSLGVVALALLGGGALPSEEVPPEGIVIGRMPIEGLEGMEAIAVYRELPGGAESGWHEMEAGSEVVYIQEGSVVLEVRDQDALTVEAGQTFTTVAGQVHNVKNASAEEVVKAVAFYIGKEGGTGADVLVMVE